VTLPHKEAVVERAKQFDGPVQDIGAANTLYRGADGVWRGANSDYDAALASLNLGLQPTEPGAEPIAEPLMGKRVLMLGAGGVARAIGLGVMRAGGALTVANRTHDRAVELAKHLGCQQILWENRGAAYADILINCTSLGMHPDVNQSPYAENWLREGMLVFDTVYNPEQTLLIKHAKDRGCRVVTGVEMFVRQAAIQSEKFTGRPAPLELMREALRKGISAAS
jgi:3-dehydroquinate dehydratase/shikimate dehydrogenase